jgi:hypothetical protein
MRQAPKRPNLLDRIAAVAFLVLIGTGSLYGQQAPKQVDPADWMPPNSVFYIGCPDVAALQKAFKLTPAYKFFEDPQFSPITEPLVDEINSAMREAAEELGLDGPDDLKVVPEHGLGIAVVAPEPGGEAASTKPDFLIVAAMGKNREKAETLLQRITVLHLENKGRRESEEFDDKSTIVTLSPTEESLELRRERNKEEMEENHVHGDAESSEEFGFDEFGRKAPMDIAQSLGGEDVSFSWRDDVVVLSNSVDLVARTLRRLSGDADDNPLSGQRKHQIIQQQCGPAGLVRFLIDLPALFRIGEEENESFQKTFAALNLEAFGSLAGTFDFPPQDDVYYELRCFMPLMNVEYGLPRILAMANRPLTPPAGHSKDTVMLFTLNLDPVAIFDESMAIAKRLDPMEAEQTAAMLDKIPISLEDPPQTISLRDDVLAHFRGPLTVSLLIKKPFGLTSMQFFLTLGHGNRDAIANLLGVLGMPVQPREVLGQTVYDFSNVAPMMSLSLAVTESALAFGFTETVADMIRALQRSGESALARSEEFQKAIRTAPKEAWLMAYINRKPMVQWFRAMLTNPELGGMPVGPGAFGRMLIDAFGGEMDELEAPYKAMEKFLSVELLAISTTEAGLKFVAHSLKADHSEEPAEESSDAENEQSRETEE